MNTYEILEQVAEQCSNWPFKYVNGHQTSASVSLEGQSPVKPLEGYNLALTETTQKALI